MNKLFINN